MKVENSHEALDLIQPDWPAPKNVRAFVSTRKGGVSEGEYMGLNLGAHVNDNPDHVAYNRLLLQRRTTMPNTLVWLNQVHGTRTLELPFDSACSEGLHDQADASTTKEANQVCAILTADCLPVFLTNSSGTQVSALHAGWRGLCDGVIEQAVNHFDETENLMAWLGPAIGPQSFEVGEEVKEAFVDHSPEAALAFTPKAGGKWLGDLYLLARQRLSLAGVNQIYGGDRCTFIEKECFYSYRRDGVTGRMASVIWFE